MIINIINVTYKFCHVYKYYGVIDLFEWLYHGLTIKIDSTGSIDHQSGW